MASSDVNSAHAQQRESEGDIEMGANETQMATPTPQGHEIQAEEPPAPQAQATQPSSQVQETQPDGSLSREDKEVRLYVAALNGDWESAKVLLLEDPRLLCNRITEETALHVAAGARQTKFVEKLVEMMKPDYLKLPDKNGNTAFCLAAAAGAKSIAEIMRNKEPGLPKVRGNKGLTPLYMAARFGQADMVRYLLHHIPETEERDRRGLFFAYIDIGLFDLALTLLDEDPELAVRDCSRERGTALHMLARKPSAFASKNPGIWKTLIKSYTTSKHRRELKQTDHALELVRRLWKIVLEQSHSEVQDLIRQPSALLLDAAKLGNFEFLAELMRLYPHLIWEEDGNRQTIFHIAVLHRHMNIFNHIHKIGSIKDIIAEYEVGSEKNNILHLAAKLPHQSRLNVVSGAALQMQRELIWFKEVEKIVKPSSREKKNSNELTPQELFTEEHKDLLQEGEKWMQKTANSSMLVATLITTVVFAAAFTIPGNYTNEGIPILLNNKTLSLFAISNAIAMISSSTSILMFLSILTSRYTEDDFLRSLPSKLIIGLTALFISIASMLLAFSTTFYINYHHKSSQVALIVASFALVPVILFTSSQGRLLFDIIRSTSRGFLCQPAQQKLF